MLLRRTAFLLLVAHALSLTPALGQVMVSVRDTSARPVDTLLVPVDVSGLVPGNEIFGVQATLAIGSPGVTIFGVETSGTLSAGSSALYNSTTSKLAIAFTSPATSNGILIYLKVAVSGSPGSTYTISMTGLQLNEGSPTATADNGSLYIRYVYIQPHAPTGVVLGDTLVFSVTGNPVLPLTWSSSAPSIGSIDANGRFIALTQGFVRVRVVDGEGKSDSSSAFSVNPTTLRSLTITIPDTSQVQTLEIGIPVRVSDVTGLGITSAQFTITYNTTYLQYVSSTAAGTMTVSWNAPTVNPSVPGTVQYALAGTTELSGSGPLIFARFLVKAAPLSPSPVNLSNVQFNEGIEAILDNGIFTPLPAPLITVVPGRFSALKGETVPVVSTIGGTGPYAYASSNPVVATVNSGTGLLTVLTRGPVRILVTDGQGFPGSSDTIRTYDFVASLPDTGFLKGDSIDIPLMIGTTTGLNITSYQFNVGYDTAVVAFRGVVSNGSLSEGYAIDVRDTSGVLRIAGAGASPLAGAGRLMSLRFLAQPGAENDDFSYLNISNFQFNEPGSLTPAALPVSGRVGIVVPSFARSFIFDGLGDRVRVTDAAPLNPSAIPSAYQISGNAITLEAWVYLIGLPGVNAEYVIAARGATSTFGVDPWFSYALRVENSTGVPRFNFLLSTGTAGEIFGATADTVSVQTGRWYHVAGTYDGTTARLYVEGELKSAQVSGGMQIGSGSIGFYIGGTTYGYFKGLIDEVRLWNVSRDQTQIQTAKDAALLGTESGLAGYWPLDSTYVSGSDVLTPDRTVNHNDLAVQFDARMAAFPHGSTVQFAPTNLSIAPAAVGGGYALTETAYNALLLTDGWPVATINVTQSPTGMTLAGDSIHWTPIASQFGRFPIVASLTNSVGSIDDTVYVFVEAIRTFGNQVSVDITHRGKFGAFGGFDKGVRFNGKNGLYAGDFSLVDRNNAKYAGGLYATTNSFRPVTGFTDIPSRFNGFTAFSTSFTDEWETGSRIGVRVFQVAHVKQTAPDDRYTIIEYRVVNESGSPIDDIFAQMSADFDIGVLTNNVGGYDSTLGLAYSFENGGATNSAYYGFQLLSHAASGAAVIEIGQDPSFIRSTANLTSFPAIAGSAIDTRIQISTGPFTLASNETLTVAFSYLAADDLNQLRITAQQARTTYESQTTSVPYANGALPKAFTLEQNYPNPFNPSTMIGFNLPVESAVRLEVYNVLGQRVAILRDGPLGPGFHQVEWNQRIDSGVYYYRIESVALDGSERRFAGIRRMILLK